MQHTKIDSTMKKGDLVKTRFNVTATIAGFHGKDGHVYSSIEECRRMNNKKEMVLALFTNNGGADITTLTVIKKG